MFENIADATKAKAMRNKLVQCYSGDTLVKKAKLQSLRKKYENLSMKDNENVPLYISKVIVVTNEMKAYGETLSKQAIVDKILRSLTPQFDYTFVAIEHCKDTINMRIKEL